MQVKFDKSYNSIENEQRRKEIFFDNLKNIREHNEKYKKGESSYEQGINQFSDLVRL